VRRLKTVVAAALVAAAAASCGGGGGGKSTSAAPTTSSSALPQPVANVLVRPPAGNVGTTFTLFGTGFQPGETVTFEIGFPDGKKFTGQPHKTTPDGALSAPYKASPGNPAGSYTVRATGDQGTTGQNTFTLGGAPTATTATTR
jgi:hypothetical protein